MPEKRIQRRIELSYFTEPDLDEDVFVEWEGRLVPNRVGVTIRQAGKGAQRPAAELRYAIRAGRAECVSFTMNAAGDERGITSNELTLLNVETLGREAFDNFATRAREGSTLGDARRLARTIDALLRDVAIAYLDPRNRDAPAKAVAKIGAMDGYHPRQVARYIERARAAGLIPGARLSTTTQEELDAAYARLMEGESNGEAR